MNFIDNQNKGFDSGIVIKIVILGLLLSLSFVLHYLTNFIPWAFTSWLKFDFSLLPIIISLFVVNIKGSYALIILRFLFAIMISSDPASIWLGPLIQLIVAAFYMTMLFLMIKLSLFSKIAIFLRLTIIFIIVSILTTIFATFLNWLGATTLYFKIVYEMNEIPILPFEFDSYLDKKLEFKKKYFNSSLSWHSISWIIYTPFNITKFGVISMLSLPIIRMSKKYYKVT